MFKIQQHLKTTMSEELTYVEKEVIIIVALILLGLFTIFCLVCTILQTCGTCDKNRKHTQDIEANKNSQSKDVRIDIDSPKGTDNVEKEATKQISIVVSELDKGPETDENLEETINLNDTQTGDHERKHYDEEPEKTVDTAEETDLTESSQDLVVYLSEDTVSSEEERVKESSSEQYGSLSGKLKAKSDTIACNLCEKKDWRSYMFYEEHMQLEHSTTNTSATVSTDDSLKSPEELHTDSNENLQRMKSRRRSRSRKHQKLQNDTTISSNDSLKISTAITPVEPTEVKNDTQVSKNESNSDNQNRLPPPKNLKAESVTRRTCMACEYCEKKYHRKINYEEHLRLEHSPQITSITSSTDDSPKTSETVHTNSNENLQRMKSRRRSRSRKHKKLQNDTTFSSNDLLEITPVEPTEINNVQNDTDKRMNTRITKSKPTKGERSLKCPQCVRMFYGNSGMEKHILEFHLKEKPNDSGFKSGNNITN